MNITPKRASAVVFVTSMFLAITDAQIVNVALPSISRHFGVPTSTAQWLVIGYLLSLAVCIPASGWAGDRYGTKRMFIWAVVIFTTASALCALSVSMGMLIAMRVLQGAGGGMLMPLGAAIMYRAYPHTEFVRVSRMTARVVMLAPALAPLLGGALIDLFSWRWIFLINVPIGIFAAAFAVRYLEEYRREGVDSGYDFAGLVMGGPGLALVLYGVSAGPTSGWSSPRVLVAVVLGLALLAGFVRVETSREHPMLDLSLLSRSRLLSRCCLLQMLIPASFYGCLVFTSLYVQEARGYSAFISGTVTFPEAIAIGVSSQFVARLYPRVGPRRLMAFGFFVLASAAFALSYVGDSTSLWTIRGLCVALGVGCSYVMMPLQSAAYAEISKVETGHATAIVTTANQVGAAIGIAALTTVLAATAGTTTHPSASDFRAVYLAAAGLAVIGLLIALGIRDRDAASTMGRPATAVPEVAV